MKFVVQQQSTGRWYHMQAQQWNQYQYNRVLVVVAVQDGLTCMERTHPDTQRNGTSATTDMISRPSTHKDGYLL
jgi:hypothetical protein